MMGMSPYRPKNSPHHGMRVRRPTQEIQDGSKLPANPSLWITLYENLSGRVLPLRRIDPNDLREPIHQGEVKLGERQVVLTPNYPLTKLKSGDFLGIPWGVRPNTWTPPNVPKGTGPFILIDTPSGNQYLQWDGEKFVGNTITILLDGVWKIDGEIEYDFSSDSSFAYQTFPSGYKFKRATGHLANFKIIRIDEHQDNLGRIGFYTLSVEKYDTEGVHLVE